MISDASATTTPTEVTQGGTPTVSPSASPAAGNTMPKLVDLTYEQATALLPKNVRIGSDDSKTAPPSPAQANIIYYQHPPSGMTIPTDVTLMVSIKRYGSGLPPMTAITPSAPATPVGIPPSPQPQPQPPVSQGPRDDLIGDWQGAIVVEKKQMKLNVSISKQGGNYLVAMAPLPPRKARLENGKLVLDMGAYSGAVQLQWRFSANGYSLAVQMIGSGAGQKGSYGGTLQRRR